MRSAMRKLGNSCGVVIPKSMLAEIGIAAGDTVELSIQDDRIMITPVKRRLREGWSAAFAELGKLGDEDLAWLHFGNEGDDELRW